MNKDIRKTLDANIPEDAVETRDGGGRKLSYLSGAYVIKRMNEVFGQGNWEYQIDSLTKVFEGEVEQRSGKVFATSYIAEVRLRAYLSGRGNEGKWFEATEFMDVGYGDGTDRTNPGKAHELAVKEAVTDGIKRAAKNLGISMGLGLYFKDGQYVGAEEEVAQPVGNESRSEKKNSVPLEQPTQAKTNPVAKSSIKSAFAVLKSQGKSTPEEFKAKYLENKKVDDLNDDQAQLAWKKITTDFKELTA
jgi:recombination DNA repair RAD52 pathway protein